MRALEIKHFISVLFQFYFMLCEPLNSSSFGVKRSGMTIFIGIIVYCAFVGDNVLLFAILFISCSEFVCCYTYTVCRIIVSVCVV